MSADFTPEKEDYKILTPFKMQVLTNFPYIEADFDALTNYQLLCKVVEYLNGVIHNENEVTEQVNSLYNAYISLQNYVNNYFENELPDLVNNKLDEMAEDGTLESILSTYITNKVARYYPNVENMKEDTSIEENMIIGTLGRNTINDKGSAIYKIIDDEITADDGSIIELDNGLKAIIINNGYFNIMQLGLTNIIEKIENVISNNSNIVIDGLNIEILSEDGFDISNVHDLELKNLNLNGIDKIQFRYGNNIKIHDSIFKNTKHDCLTFQYSDNIEIYNNIFDNIGTELTQYNLDGRGVYFYNYQNSDDNMNDNQFIHDNLFNNINGKGAVVIHHNCNKFKINNNYITNTVWSGIELYTITSSNASFIENNYLYNIGQKTPVATDEYGQHSGVGASAIYGNGDCNNISVLNNIIINCLENGIEGSYSNIKGNTIYVTGKGSNVRTTTSIEGIYVNQYTTNVNIENNNVFSKYRSIVIAPGTNYNNIKIANNGLSCESGDNIYFNGITLDSFSIKNNILDSINGTITGNYIETLIIDNPCTLKINNLLYENGYVNVGNMQPSKDCNLFNTNSEWTLTNGTITDNVFTTSSQYGGIGQTYNLENIFGHTNQLIDIKLVYNSSDTTETNSVWLRINNNSTLQLTLKGTGGTDKTINALFYDNLTSLKNNSQVNCYLITSSNSLSVKNMLAKTF